MSDESDANPVVRKGSLWRTARAVGWSFFGVRRSSGFEGDVAQIKPLHIVVVGIVGLLLFVVSLIALVNWVVAK